MGFIITYSGKKFDFDNITKESIDIEDIAHALSQQCRFNGHCSEFYSVAEHSYLMSKYVMKNTKKKMLALKALLHDSVEAYISDIPSPFKNSLFVKDETHISLFEDKILNIIAAKFNIPGKIYSKYIKALDNSILNTELKDLLSYKKEIESFLDIKIRNYKSNIIKDLFLNQFYYLKENLENLEKDGIV